MATRKFNWLLSFVVLGGGACNGPNESPKQSPEAVGQVGQALEEVTTVDLSRYTLIGRHSLPEPSRTTPPNGVSLLAQEASSVTYNWDTDTLFVVGDSGTSVVQISKTGALIDSMTLAPGSSPQGTEFYDTEGIAYVGGGQFVFTEERYRQVVRFSYVAGATLNRVDVQTVKLGTTIGNVGLEGVSYDPVNSTFIFLKEKDPRSIFETSINFPAGTASNGSPTTIDSIDLFAPALVNTLDFSDIFALSNLPALSGDPTYAQLLILSQESGKIVQVDRSGNVQHTLTIVAAPSDTLAVADMTMEGITMDRDGNLYVVNENGGGDSSQPQLWVYGPSSAENTAPTAVALTGAVTSLPEETNTTVAVNLAQIFVTDDGLGDNTLSVSGPDASAFEVVGTALFLKAGTALSATTKPSYQINVNVDDSTLGATPDATTSYTLSITPAGSGGVVLAITEVAAWASGNSPLASDWFELTNVGTASVSLVGWAVDDNSNSSALSVALNGVTSISPGESVIFIETTPATLAAKAQAFRDLWFGASAPAGLKIGSYSGSGIGLSTGGDAVNLFDNSGAVRANVSFGTSPGSAPFATFDNATGLDNATISTLSAVGQQGAFVAANSSSEIGSPGTVGAGATVLVGVTATDNQASETGGNAGVFRFTRSGNTTSPLTVIYTIAAGAGQAVAADYTPSLSGSQVIPSGAAFVDVTITPVDDALLEGSEALTLALTDTGSYDVGPNASASVTLEDNDNTPPAPTLAITEVSPWASGNSPLACDWFEVTNMGSTSVSLVGWTVDDNSNSIAASVALNGVTSIGPGESVLFLETTAATLATKAQQLRDLWYGASPPSGLQIGNYSGSGIGLGTGGDAVNLFDNTATLRANVSFGSSPSSAPYATFENATGANNTLISTLSVVGQRGAFIAVNSVNEIGSPGAISSPAPVLVSVSATDNQASETSGGTGVFRFSRSGSTSAALTVSYVITSGAGQASASDYTPSLSGSLVIPSGAGVLDVTITPVDDALVEGTEALTLTVTDTSSYDVGAGPSATITIEDNDNPPPTSTLVISEVAPWSSSSALGRDWFEVTNTGSSVVTITGWSVDDSSHAFATAVPMSGVTSIAPGEAVIFIEAATADLASAAAAFRSLWFGAKVQPAPQIGSYTGSGIGLSTGGDEVTLFDAAGNLMTGVGFGTAPSSAPFATFDNHEGVPSNTLPVPLVTTLSSVGVNRAFVAAADSGAVGSPGIGNVGRLLITEIVPWASGNSPYSADWFEVTNVGSAAVDVTGWTVDDSSNSFASSVPMTGVGSIAAGHSAVFFEGNASIAPAFVAAWFGSNPPDGLLLGSYTGSGIGLSTGGDAVNLFDAAGQRITGVQFGAATDLFTFDNAAGLSTVTTLSVAGVNGAFLAFDGTETGSPGAIENGVVTEPVAVPALPAGWAAFLAALMLGLGTYLSRVSPTRIRKAC